MGRDDEDNGYPRKLDSDGCIFGRRVRERQDEVVENYKKLEKRLGQLTTALVATALTFTVSGILLALNLLFR